MCIELWKIVILAFEGMLYDECVSDAPSSYLKYISNMYLLDIVTLGALN